MTASAPKAVISWSSGKDSAFALLEAHRLGLAEIVGVLMTVNEVQAYCHKAGLVACGALMGFSTQRKRH